jgi:hypothetical protein
MCMQVLRARRARNAHSAASTHDGRTHSNPARVDRADATA